MALSSAYSQPQRPGRCGAGSQVLGDQAGPGPSREETAGSFISKAGHSVSGEALLGVSHVQPETPWSPQNPNCTR